jgi:hypothetical protein
MQMHQKFPFVYWGMCSLCRYKLVRSRRELSKLTDLCNMAMVQIVATPLPPHKSADFVCCANNPTAKYNSRLNPYMQKQQTAFGIITSCKQMSLVLIMHKWQFPQTLIIPKIRCANVVQQEQGMNGWKNMESWKSKTKYIRIRTTSWTYLRQDVGWDNFVPFRTLGV